MKVNGRSVETSGGTVTLNTANAQVEFVPMNWREQFLGTISDPNITYILMMVGVFGILFELFNPGAILPGVVGAISLILAFYAFQTLPINYAGLALILLAIILFIAEVKIVSHGLLAVGGVISLFLGSVMLIDLSIRIGNHLAKRDNNDRPGRAGLFHFDNRFLGLRAQQKKSATGFEGMVGERGSGGWESGPIQWARSPSTVKYGKLSLTSR